MAVASAAVVFASVAVFASVYSAADRQTPVLIAATTIVQGQPITGSVLGQASVSISGPVTPIPAADASELSGKRAAVTIPAGSLLTMSDVTGAQPIAAGDAVVGLALKSGQLPSSGVKPGDQVMIVQTASPGSPLATGPSAGSPSDTSGAATGVLVPQASVFDVQAPPVNSSGSISELVSIEVSSTFAAAVATTAAADQVSLVLLPAGTSAQTPSTTGNAGGVAGGAQGQGSS
jgi:hypothetical protein